MKRTAAQAFSTEPEKCFIDLANSPPSSPTEVSPNSPLEIDLTDSPPPSPSIASFANTDIGTLLCCTTGQPLAVFKQWSSSIVLTDPMGESRELGARIQGWDNKQWRAQEHQSSYPMHQTLVLSKRWVGSTAREREALVKSNLDYELQRRVDDLEAIRAKAVARFEELAACIAVHRRGFGKVDVVSYLDDEEYRMLMGIQLQHKSAIIQIETIDQISVDYSSWTIVSMELRAGVSYKLPWGQLVVVCPLFFLLEYAPCRSDIRFFSNS